MFFYLSCSPPVPNILKTYTYTTNFSIIQSHLSLPCSHQQQIIMAARFGLALGHAGTAPCSTHDVQKQQVTRQPKLCQAAAAALAADRGRRWEHAVRAAPTTPCDPCNMFSCLASIGSLEPPYSINTGSSSGSGQQRSPPAKASEHAKQIRRSIDSDNQEAAAARKKQSGLGNVGNKRGPGGDCSRPGVCVCLWVGRGRRSARWCVM